MDAKLVAVLILSAVVAIVVYSIGPSIVGQAEDATPEINSTSMPIASQLQSEAQSTAPNLYKVVGAVAIFIFLGYLISSIAGWI